MIRASSSVRRVMTKGIGNRVQDLVVRSLRAAKNAMGAAGLLLAAGCASVATHEQLDAPSISAAFRWQDEALALIQKYQVNPLRAARTLAALHGAIHETDVKTANANPACRSYSIDIVSARTLEYFFPLETPGRLRAKVELSRRGLAVCDLQAADTAVERAISRARADGAFPPRRLRSNPHPFVGEWKPAPPIFMSTPAEPFAGEWRLYFASDPATFPLVKPLHPLSDVYRLATQDVLNVASRLTPGEERAADFWHLDAGSVTPPGVWNQELRRMLAQSRNNVDTIRLLAVANQAMHDALVVCWHYKYTYWTERPVTAASRLVLGEFTSRLVTPPFPSYPSGHSTVSGAVAEVIAAYLPDQADEARRLAEEAANSRLWGGIHFDFDNEAGLVLGRQVGAAALKAMPPATKPNH
jgi:membrane-associated phospholipid phosphatase